MGMAKIVFFETMPGERETFGKLLPSGHDVEFVEGKLCLDDDMIAHAADADIISVFVNCEVTKEVIDRLPNLKLITTRSMGTDHIDVEHAQSKGVKVGNVTTYAAHPVAEFTFALLLNVARNIYPAYEQLRDGTDFDIRSLQGITLFEKTLGVIGTGRIGQQVIRIAKGFGMNVIAYDAFPKDDLAAELDFTYETLESLLSRSDIVTLHVPYLKDTHHLMNEDAFMRMKKGSYLINTARGEIVDSHALLSALEDGTLAGVGLDVLEQEQALKEERQVVLEDRPDVDYELNTTNHILIDHPLVTVTPHIAFSTKGALTEIERVTAQTINDFLSGAPHDYL